jgi:AraC-like DNA-binding protein
MVSDHFSLSERYLSSLIREQTGKNYADYILEIRIEEARRLLSDSDMPINDIAKQVGYDLPNSFYKTFKNYTGLSPSQYREHYS